MLLADKKFWTHYSCSRKINPIFVIVTFSNIDNFRASEEFTSWLNVKRVRYKAQIFSFEFLNVDSWVLLVWRFELVLNFLLLIFKLLQSIVDIFIIFIFIYLICFIILFIILFFLLIFEFLLLSSFVCFHLLLLNFVFYYQIVVVIVEVRLALIIIFILALLIIYIIMYYRFFLNN